MKATKIIKCNPPTDVNNNVVEAARVFFLIAASPDMHPSIGRRISLNDSVVQNCTSLPGVRNGDKLFEAGSIGGWGE